MPEAKSHGRLLGPGLSITLDSLLDALSKGLLKVLGQRQQSAKRCHYLLTIHSHGTRAVASHEVWLEKMNPLNGCCNPRASLLVPGPSYRVGSEMALVKWSCCALGWVDLQFREESCEIPSSELSWQQAHISRILTANESAHWDVSHRVVKAPHGWEKREGLLLRGCSSWAQQ